MKTALDPRHAKRQKIVGELFRNDFHPQTIQKEAQQILAHKENIDKRISQAAPEFPIEKINKVDLSILRLATYELLIEKKEPERVIIDEAIELAKELGGETSPSFVNGVLGNILAHANTNI